MAPLAPILLERRFLLDSVEWLAGTVIGAGKALIATGHGHGGQGSAVANGKLVNVSVPNKTGATGRPAVNVAALNGRKTGHGSGGGSGGGSGLGLPNVGLPSLPSCSTSCGGNNGSAGDQPIGRQPTAASPASDAPRTAQSRKGEGGRFPIKDGYYWNNQ